MSKKVVIGNAVLCIGDCREVLATLPSESVHCCVTSPPYFGLRDYGVDGQMGLEATPDEFVAALVGVFREVQRVLHDDGTLWLNLGDTYATNGGPGWQGKNGERSDRRFTGTRNTVGMREQSRTAFKGHKPKDLLGIPWRVAFALQADGWYLRQDIIWHKPNPMPESVRDRCTKAHEYIFLLSKSPRYYYDAEAIREPASANTRARLPGNKRHSVGASGETHHRTKTGLVAYAERKRAAAGSGIKNNDSMDAALAVMPDFRNKRSVWTVPSEPFPEAHFATFPPGLIRPCILAGCPEGGTVLDPFNGAGTTGLVALEHGRRYIGIELNPEYVAMSMRRIEDAQRQARLFA